MVTGWLVPLGALVQAKSYAVAVDSTWNVAADPHGPQGGSHYRMTWQEGRSRVEVQSLSAQSPDLICVNDGALGNRDQQARVSRRQRLQAAVCWQLVVESSCRPVVGLEALREPVGQALGFVTPQVDDLPESDVLSHASSSQRGLASHVKRRYLA